MNEIRYDDNTHTYWYGPLRYLSATQIIDLVKQPFDEDFHAKRFSDKFGHTPDHWLRYWKKINHDSKLRGDLKHDLMESIIKHRSMDVVHGKSFKVQNTELFAADLNLSRYPDGIYTEEILFHHGYHIAGRADKIILETIKGVRYAHIDDYKTNKRLRTHSFRFADGSYQMLKKPLEHLMDCEMVHYTLQLSLYMLMLEYHGFKPGNMRLIHFPHVPEMAPPGAEDPPPVVYPIEYEKRDVVSLLSYLRRKQ